MPDLSGTILDGKYELIQLIGEGGMGFVYEARHRLIGRRLAIKFLHSEFASNEEVVIRFQREAQAAAAIGHDNIIEVTDMGQTQDGSPFLVMEFLEGYDVRHLLESTGSLPVEQAAEIMVQALSALEAAHQVGIIHRDLKPENIFLIEKFETSHFVKLLDFGISKFNALDDQNHALTRTGTIMGTPYYMSPEQANGSSTIGVASDIYAMGIILFQMLTGRLPFDAPNYTGLLVKILTEPSPDPLDFNPNIPEALAAAIRKAMDKEASQRFSSCSEFRECLLPFAPTATSRSLPNAPAPRTTRASALPTETPLEMARSRGPEATKPKRRPILIGAAVTLAIGVALAIIQFGIPGETSTPNSERTGSEGLSMKTTHPTGAAQSPEPTAAVPERIHLNITVDPPAATISVDGVVRSNPHDDKVAKDGKDHTVEIHADGYIARTEVVRFDSDQTLSFTLDKADDSAAVEKQDVAASKRSSKHSKRTGRRSHRTAERGNKDDKNEAPDKAHKSAFPPDAKAPVEQKKNKRRNIDFADPWESIN